MRSAAEHLLCGLGAAAWVRRRRAADIVILAYHNIVPNGATARGDVSLHLSQRSFSRQLDLLERTHDVVPLASVRDAGVHRRPRAVITFDDAYAGAVTAGCAELARRGMPATVFVAPGFVGGQSFWWDALDEGVTLTSRTRAHALQSEQGRDERVRAWAAGEGIALRDVPWHQRCATEGQLQAMPPDLVTLGSHSWSHPNLTMLDGELLATELTRPLAWLRERFTNAISWLAYPYGLTSPKVAPAARAAGYEGALRVAGGWLRTDGAGGRDLLDLPRQNVPAGLSLRGFELRVSGVLQR